MIKKINKFINDNRDGIVSAAPIVSSAFGIKQGTVGQIGSAIGSFIPGPAGTAVQVASQFAGTGDHRTVNELTGEIEGDNGTGIIGGIQKLFGWGRSTNSLINKQNRIKTSLADQQLTQDLNYNFYQDPNNSMNGSIFATAAEGGVMRRPVDALVSPGEIAIDPITLEYEQFGSDNEKPNSKDNIPTVLETGYIVRSHAKHMIMPNGKTSAENSKMVLDSNAPEEMKRVMIKKIGNWESAHRTKPQQYAKFSGGGIAGINKYGYNKNMSDFAYWDKDKNEYKKEYLDWVNKITEQDVKDIFNGDYGDMSTYKGINPNYIPTVEEARKLMTDKKYGDWHKIGKAVIDKKIKKTITSPEDTVIRRPVYEEPVKVADTPVDDTKVYGREGDVRYDYLAPERKVNPAELGRSVDSDINHNGSDWRDSLYRMTVLSQPLWGREKAEPVDYTSPVYKYMPTAIDVSSQLESADQNYALSRYNFANLYPNTGASMAASLQAASNRAKQYADIRQWQTNAQNELIGKNAGIYNNWSNEHARILNDVRNKYAQNRATARNINRQNMSAMLGNLGTMLRDDKQFDVDIRNNELKTKMLEPFIQSVYENSDELMSVLAQYGMSKNIKKKQNNN